MLDAAPQGELRPLFDSQWRDVAYPRPTAPSMS